MALHDPKVATCNSSRVVPPCACLLPPGAEFWAAFFFTSTIAIPILLYSTGLVLASSLVLALLGILLTVFSVGLAAFLQARAESDAYSAW